MPDVVQVVFPVVPLALYLPYLSEVPRWLQITVGVVVLGLMVARVVLLWRRRK